MSAPEAVAIGSWAALRADIARYRNDPWVSRYFWWLAEKSSWAVIAFRVGNGLRETLPAVLAGPLLKVYSLLVMPLIDIVTGVELPLSVTAGPGLRIYHGTGLVLSGGVVLGARCTLRQGVCLGTLTEGGSSPVIGDDVTIGVHGQVLGPVRIGDRAKIGAGAVVITDVPDDATAVGVPARVIPARG